MEDGQLTYVAQQMTWALPITRSRNFLANGDRFGWVPGRQGYWRLSTTFSYGYAVFTASSRERKIACL